MCCKTDYEIIVGLFYFERKKGEYGGYEIAPAQHIDMFDMVCIIR